MYLYLTGRKAREKLGKSNNNKVNIKGYEVSMYILLKELLIENVIKKIYIDKCFGGCTMAQAYRAKLRNE